MESEPVTGEPFYGGSPKPRRDHKGNKQTGKLSSHAWVAAGNEHFGPVPIWDGKQEGNRVRAPSKGAKKPPRKAAVLLVAGAGFEPATFRL